MSLLMEALKKAEEAKRLAAGAPAQAEAPSLPEEDTSNAQVLSALAAHEQTETLPALEFSALAESLPPPPSQPAATPDVPLQEIASFPQEQPLGHESLSQPVADVRTHPPVLELEVAPQRPQTPPEPHFPREENRAIPGKSLGTAKHSTVSAPPPRPPEPLKRNDSQPEKEQQAAQNLFQAKQPSGTSQGKQKHFLIFIGIFALMGAVSIGIYFWLQLQPKNGLGVIATNPPAKPLPPPAPLPVPAPQSVPTPAPTAANPPEELPPRSAPEKKQEVEPVLAAPKEMSKGTNSQAQRAATAPPEGPIRITTSRLRLDPALEKGFDAFQKGDLPAAKAAYELALKNDANSLDALSGLAMTHLRSNRGDLAEPLFQRILEIDPRNSLAQASLVGLRDPSDPVQMESRLKTALSEQPDAPHLYFSLGNLYARQNRWADAQQVYFRAMSGDPENPDYLFNLAISLDRLHQAKLARQYYEQALSAAERRPSGFDRNLASERLRKLQP